jgi:uncharacterized protein (UPF0548 family)
MRFVRPSDTEAMKRLVASLDGAEPTYGDVGATLTGQQPEGFHHDRYEVVLGSGPETFQRAVVGLKSWEAHRLPGVRVFPQGQEIRKGVTVILTLGTSVMAIAAPCRIVSVVDGQTRWGFAYGTLPGHPEQGEESFAVSISSDQTVRFEIEAFSRPSDPIVRLSGPIGRGVQRGGTGAYLRSLKRFVDARAH